MPRPLDRKHLKNVSDRRVASYDPSTTLPPHITEDPDDRRLRIVSDGVVIRNRDNYSPPSLASAETYNDEFNFWPMGSSQYSGPYPVDSAYEPDFTNPPNMLYSDPRVQAQMPQVSAQLEQLPPPQNPTFPRQDSSNSALPRPLFSFSDADESVGRFNAPNTRSTFEEDFDTNSDLVSFQTLPDRRNTSDSDLNTIQSSLPPKSIPGTYSALGLIIENTDMNSSAVTVHKPEDQFRHSLLSVPQIRDRELRLLQDLFLNTPAGPKDHLRNNSASSTLSNTSTSSTITKSNNEQRFLRYAMSTQSPQSSLKPSNRWLMTNVLSWLEYHGFNESWKGTFKRNEISGNRFLELCNYDVSSNIWKQFSERLEFDNQKNNVERFILLLRSELEALEYPKKSLNPTDAEGGPRAENRKSSSTLWTQTPSYNPTKPRPFSYVEPSNIKYTPGREHHRDTSHSHKFFRLHHRASSTDSSREPSSSSTSLPSQGNFLLNPKTGGDEVRPPMNSAGSRRSGIFSSLWKYGGDKAAGIVKQVQPSTSSQKNPNNRKSSYGLSHGKKGTELQAKQPTFVSRGSAASLARLQEGTISSNSSDDTNPPLSEETILSPIEDVLLTNESKKQHDQIDARYFPTPKADLVDESKLILVTTDNMTFKPLKIFIDNLEDVNSLRHKLAKAAEVLDIGNITYHLTDFDCIPGESMSDEVLVQALKQSLFCKIYLQQSVKSPGTATISSTSSDSKSFDTTGEINGGNIYPATPQYLLQDVRDKGVDYINFKEQDSWAHVREMERNRNIPAVNNPLKLSMPANRRALAAALQRNMMPINPQSAVKLPGDPKQDKSPALPMSNEARDIELEKGRQPSRDRGESFSALNARSARSRSGSLISNQRDDKANTSLSSKSTRSSKLKEDSTSRVLSSGLDFVARRKAPPPPTRSQKSNGQSLPDLSQQSDETFESGTSDKLSRKRKSSKKTEEDPNAFAENHISFDDAPAFSPVTPLESSREVSLESDDEDSFFMKPVKREQKVSLQSNNLESDSDDDGFFMKPIQKKRASQIERMKVRPPVEEVYNNLEKYFPNTNLDKPIIDASPESPVLQRNPKPSQLFPTKRENSISRTFSNANNSPVNPPTDIEDEPLQTDGEQKLRRKMKTIRIVANEARNKRLASQKAVRTSENQVASRGKRNASGSQLRRANTKLWGQKVVEVTSAEIEKGFISRLRNNTNGLFEEFAWIKGELIGRGSFGSVYLALNVTTGEMLAVKQVVVSGSSDESEGLDALHKEVETMKDLDHLNIVQYLGFEQKKNTYSLFLEYVAGGSISSCLKTLGKFDEPLVRYITRQVLEGLRYLHSNGILHRDLKADNLLLETDGTCKISDFGISKKSQDIYSNNAEMSMQGTVFWMAPEVIHSIVEDKKQGYSAKVDIWSLGCVVLEMLAGKRPWSNEAVISAIYKIGKTKLAPPIPNNISDDAKDFVNACFTIDSEMRPTAEKLLEHKFMKVDESFSFNNTRLSEVIKFNSRRVYST